MRALRPALTSGDAAQGYIDVFTSDFIAQGADRITRCRKPTIAAVANLRLAAVANSP